MFDRHGGRHARLGSFGHFLLNANAEIGVPGVLEWGHDRVCLVKFDSSPLRVSDVGILVVCRVAWPWIRVWSRVSRPCIPC